MTGLEFVKKAQGAPWASMQKPVGLGKLKY